MNNNLIEKRANCQSCGEMLPQVPLMFSIVNGDCNKCGTVTVVSKKRKIFFF